MYWRKHARTDRRPCFVNSRSSRGEEGQLFELFTHNLESNICVADEMFSSTIYGSIAIVLYSYAVISKYPFIQLTLSRLLFTHCASSTVEIACFSNRVCTKQQNQRPTNDGCFQLPFRESENLIASCSLLQEFTGDRSNPRK